MGKVTREELNLHIVVHTGGEISRVYRQPRKARIEKCCNQNQNLTHCRVQKKKEECEREITRSRVPFHWRQWGIILLSAPSISSLFLLQYSPSDLLGSSNLCAWKQWVGPLGHQRATRVAALVHPFTVQMNFAWGDYGGNCLGASTAWCVSLYTLLREGR